MAAVVGANTAVITATCMSWIAQRVASEAQSPSLSSVSRALTPKLPSPGNPYACVVVATWDNLAEVN